MSALTLVKIMAAALILLALALGFEAWHIVKQLPDRTSYSCHCP